MSFYKKKRMKIGPPCDLSKITYNFMDGFLYSRIVYWMIPGDTLEILRDFNRKRINERKNYFGGT
jgi:hypothetical protein